MISQTGILISEAEYFTIVSKPLRFLGVTEHEQTVCTRSFLLLFKEPGDEATLIRRVYILLHVSNSY